MVPGHRTGDNPSLLARSAHTVIRGRGRGVVMEEREDKLQKAEALSRRLARRSRPRGVNHRRLTRTLLLGTLAVAAAIYWLAVEYAVDMRELAGFLGTSVLFVILFTALAIFGALVLRALRRLQNRSRRPPEERPR